LGYQLHEAYRRGKDAVVVGYKRELYRILDKEVVDYNDLVKLYKNLPGMDSNDFLVHNKAIICLL